MARRALLTAGGTVELVDGPSRALSDGEFRIRSEFGAAKHGTELAMLRGYGAQRGGWDGDLRVWRAASPALFGELPAPIGNMVVGTVYESLNARFPEGTRVAAHSGFAEDVVVRDAWPLADGVTWKSAVCVDPAEFALGAIRDGGVRIGDSVAIFGLGAIGLMAVRLCSLAGAYPVIACDPMLNRRSTALALGADIAIDPVSSDSGVEIKMATESRGADVVIDYSGSVRALQAGLRAVAFGGVVVAGSFPDPYPAGLDLGAEAHMNRPSIVFSRANSDPNRDHPRWTNRRVTETCWRLICEGNIDGSRVVEPVISFEELPDVYMKMTADPASSIKLGVCFGQTAEG